MNAKCRGGPQPFHWCNFIPSFWSKFVTGREHDGQERGRLKKYRDETSWKYAILARYKKGGKYLWSMVFPFWLWSPALSLFPHWFLYGLLQLACGLCCNTVCYCWKRRAGKHLPRPEKLAGELLLVACSQKSTSGFARSTWWHAAGKSAPVAPSPSPCTPSRTSAGGGWLWTGSWYSRWLAGREELL